MFDAVLLNGTVGAGKSTTAGALGDVLAARGVPHAVVDVDELRRLWPSPDGDPFQQAIALRNTAAIARNSLDAGATRLVLAGVVETAADLTDLREAIGPWRLLACRLVVEPAVAARRLRERHATDPAEWALGRHLERSPELAAVLERAGIDDAIVDVEDLDPAAVAERVAALAGVVSATPSAAARRRRPGPPAARSRGGGPCCRRSRRTGR